MSTTLSPMISMTSTGSRGKGCWWSAGRDRADSMVLGLPGLFLDESQRGEHGVESMAGSVEVHPHQWRGRPPEQRGALSSLGVLVQS